jgi:predicted DNA-binding protein (UPF0251 family)
MADSMHIDDFEETLCADDEYSEPDEAVGKSLAADRVRAIISKLPRARKQVIIMYYYDGLNDREIAEALGVSRSTVKTNLMRARESIRKALGNSGDIMGIDGENKYQGNNAAPSQTLALNGAAIAPLIVGVLKSEADAAFPAKLLASLGARFEHAVGAIPDASRLQAAQQAVQPPGQGKLGIISSTAVLVAVTLIAVTSQPPAEPARYEPPQATIEFVSDEPVESVNPSDVSLKIENSWGAVSWKLFKGGEELAGGEGEFGGQVKGLAAGNYRIEWEIKDGNGNRATVGRDFVIQPPAQ